MVHPHPYLAFLKAVKIFRQERPRPAPGVHPTAVVFPGVVIGERVSIGPHAVIEEGAAVGDAACSWRTYVGTGARLGADWLYPHVVVREECVLGDRVTVHSGTVIGADGFGYVREGEIYHKVPQVGNVVIGDDVEIGANVCIDRATTGTTVVGSGTKIDNLVQIGHNVELGEHVIVVAQVGISGSTRVGRGATAAGQAGIAGHIEIGEGRGRGRRPESPSRSRRAPRFRATRRSRTPRRAASTLSPCACRSWSIAWQQLEQRLAAPRGGAECRITSEAAASRTSGRSRTPAQP